MNPESDYVLSVAIPRPLDQLFTYRVPSSLIADVKIGKWVRVPFGRGNATTHAYVIENPKPISELGDHDFIKNLKEVLEFGDDDSIIPDDVMKLCRWAQAYYQAPLGEVLHCAVPPAAFGLKLKRKKEKESKIEVYQPRHIQLTAEQQEVLNQLEIFRKESALGKNSKPALLHGVTGSGKTEIYIELAKNTLSEGRGVIVMLPEIALTPQLHHRFEASLGVPVGLWHSALSDGKRRDIWKKLRRGEIKVVVGARSSVFAPVKDLGLIIIDEEHDPSYKQDDRFKYHARDLAIVRAHQNGGFVVLGSATPSLESRQRAAEGRYHLAHLKNRVFFSSLPKVEIVDLTEEEMVETCQAPLAKRTLEAIQETLSAGQQVMVFLNRRGYAAFLICTACGDVRTCPNCSISLSVHKKKRMLRCHLCNHYEALPDQCSKCSSSELQFMGSGVESLEEELPKLLTDAKIGRLDRDQITSASRLNKTIQSFRDGKTNLLVGTQMLVKGHDFPNVTLVVVVLADNLFRFPDFRASERAFQILTQVSGRAGRGEIPGKVLIQTYSPDHPVLDVVRGNADEESWLETELELRKILNYSPFARLARVRIESNDKDISQTRAHDLAKNITSFIEAQGISSVEVLGPSEAFLEKVKNSYRWDLLLKAARIGDLQKILQHVRKFSQERRWIIIVDVDPNGVG